MSVVLSLPKTQFSPEGFVELQPLPEQAGARLTDELPAPAGAAETLPLPAGATPRSSKPFTAPEAPPSPSLIEKTPLESR